MNKTSAVVGLQLVDAEAQEEHDAERAEEQHDHQRAAVDRLAEGGQHELTGAIQSHDRGLEGEIGDDAGQRDAGGHIVVDAKHVGAQACIDHGCLPGAEAAGSYVTVEVRHRSFPLYGPAFVAGHVRRAGFCRRARGSNLVIVEPVRQIWPDHGFGLIADR